MKKKSFHFIGQIIMFTPLAGIIIASSVLKLTSFQHQLLMLFLLVWANAFFLYKSWAS